MNRQEKLELALCNYCASIYYDMDDRIIRRKDKAQTIKEPCDICQKSRGYEFIISEADGDKL